MDASRQDLALLALALLHDDVEPATGGIDLLQFAEGQAYLHGFVVELLAEQMKVGVPEALARIRSLLGEGGDGAGDREPRRPSPSPPSLVADGDEG